ncbi:MAG TPA: hypothetical protein VET23_05490 [Chitinophagaceae bacterium]|nr:hypothetical protein [Chitinophagaceae bacterium]
MKKISYWAKSHKWQTWVVIIVAFLILNTLGIITGILLQELEISVSVILMFICFFLYLAALIAYPSKSKKGKTLSRAAFYIKQKSCDFILAASTFGMIVYLANHPDRLFQSYPTISAAVKAESSKPKDSLAKGYKSIKDFSASMKDVNGNQLKWKERKKLLKEQVRNIRKSNELTNGDKTGLIILSVLVALGLIALVAALACNLSCSGSDAAAAIVGIGGTALIIFLLVLVIRNINKKKETSIDKPATTN